MSVTADRTVTYADSVTPVLPGDCVSVKLFFRRRQGEVIYVPGISSRLGEYEHNGLTWVGVSLADGWAIGEVVLPDTGRLKPSVRFLRRGTQSPDARQAMREIRRRGEDGDRAQERPSAPRGRPRSIDWFAGITAVLLKLGIDLLLVTALLATVIFLWRLL